MPTHLTVPVPENDASVLEALKPEVRAARTRAVLTDSTIWELGNLLDTSNDASQHAWLDTETGELLIVTSTYDLEEDAEDGEAEPVSQLHGWMEDERRLVATILADTTGRYLRVPIGANHAVPGVLSAFARTLTDPRLQDEVYDAMRGRGAFRRVKDLLYQRDAIDLWHRFDEERTRALALEWLESKGIQPVARQDG